MQKGSWRVALVSDTHFSSEFCCRADAGISLCYVRGGFYLLLSASLNIREFCLSKQAR